LVKEDLANELTIRDNNFQHPYEVVVTISEMYSTLSEEEKVEVDSVLTPMILALKRNGLCK